MTVIRNFTPIPTPALTLATGNQFQFIARRGFVYQLQSAPDLGGGNWANYGSAINGSNQTVTLNMQTGTGSSGFYRVQINRAP
jgi:hypothetical protein